MHNLRDFTGLGFEKSFFVEIFLNSSLKKKENNFYL